MKQLHRWASASPQPQPRKTASSWLVAIGGLLCPLFALANQGLTPATGDWLWPQLQARITVQTVALAPIAMTRLMEPGAGTAARGVQGGALLGDYVFASPSFGNFRATSGVMLGAPGGAPVFDSTQTSRLGVTVYDTSLGGVAGSPDSPSTLPYLGLGYSSASLWRSLSVSADVGLVAGRPSGLAGVGRAIFGSQALDGAMRDLRLAPVLQLGVRYSF
jgi:hypothetical protein